MILGETVSVKTVGGGIYGFKEFLEIIADPKDKRHEEMCEWGWEPFDFDRVAWCVESRV